ncbi:MAG TPA: alginate lyase family protein [Verrucomicrobiae bacterium]|nr:alginate lyase family protein [Verrucomicrobiae bacterium]
MKLQSALLFLSVWMVLHTVCADSEAGCVSLDSNEIVQLRGLISTNASAAEQFAIIRKVADKALTAKPDPIEKVVSEGHLQKDPLKIRSRAAMADRKKIYALAWSSVITGNTNYSAKAREFIVAWARVNKADGNAINESPFESVIVAYDLLRSSFAKSDQQLVDAWLQSKANALWVKYRNGGRGNWVSHGLKITGLVAMTLGNEPLTKEVMNGFRRQIAADLEADGASTDFHVRDAMGYHLYSIEPLLTLARAGERRGAHLFDFRGPNGASLHRAVDFVVSFADGSKTHMEFVNSKSSFDRERAINGEKGFQPHLWDPKASIEMFSKAAYFRPEYGKIASRVAGKPDDTFVNWEMVINAASRPTLIH